MRALEEFGEDPVKFVRYALTYERKKDGQCLAQQVVDQHLNSSKALTRQLVEIEQVFRYWHVQWCSSCVTIVSPLRCSLISIFSNASTIRLICSDATVKSLCISIIIPIGLAIHCPSYLAHHTTSISASTCSLTLTFVDVMTWCIGARLFTDCYRCTRLGL